MQFWLSGTGKTFSSSPSNEQADCPNLTDENGKVGGGRGVRTKKLVLIQESKEIWEIWSTKADKAFRGGRGGVEKSFSE